MLADTPIPEDLAVLIASRFSVLGEPLRVRILDLLRRQGETSVSDVAEQLGAGYANVAKHLTLLHRERIVGRSKDGTRVLYRIVDASVFQLCELVCGTIEQQHTERAELLSGNRFTPATAGGKVSR
ncbi:MAG TPA: metalloregulator ArsR/SmtB family transcription factor [Solirubrobacteraceae bacterium]|nr:metalloregulator ArsR/SmtB family transcription factor [Solirubrobacteraceae bacterium]